MEIREATLADLEALVELKIALVRTWFDWAEVDDHPDYPDRLRHRLREVLDHPDHQFWVACDAADGITAMVSSLVTKHLPGPDWSGVHAHIADLYVTPAHRGRGLAKTLMERAMEWCREQQAFAADMHATAAAVPMYLALGWTPRDPAQLGERFTVLEYDFRDR